MEWFPRGEWIYQNVFPRNSKQYVLKTKLWWWGGEDIIVDYCITTDNLRAIISHCLPE